MLQEALTVSTCLDGLLRGRVASVCDVLSQRLKSLESLCKGAHWSVGRQLELVRADAGITGETEGLEAARRAREEDKLKATLARLSGGRGGDYTSKKK